MNKLERELMVLLGDLGIAPKDMADVFDHVQVIVDAKACPLRHRGKPAPAAEPVKPARKARKRGSGKVKATVVIAPTPPANGTEGVDGFPKVV